MMKDAPKPIAIIPARGGSKRIPRKNIRTFAGLAPILALTIANLQEADVVGDIYVSTEDPEIAEEADKTGASVIERPEALADDHTTTLEVMQHAIKTLHDNGLASHPYIACVYATAALMDGKYLLDGLRALQKGPIATYAFPVARHRAPIERAMRIDRDTGKLIPPKKDVIDSRNQDHTPTYYDAGQWYWGLRNAWLIRQPIYHAASIPIVVPPWAAIDIDTEEDWRMAELLYYGARAVREQQIENAKLIEKNKRAVAEHHARRTA